MKYAKPEHLIVKSMPRGSSRELKNQKVGLLVTQRAGAAVFTVASLLLPPVASAQTNAGSDLPIIDMHLHALPANVSTGIPRVPSAADEESFKALAAALARHNVARAAVSGPQAYVERMAAAAPGVVIAAPAFPYPFEKPEWPDVHRLRTDYKAGRLGAMGEVLAQLQGFAPTDPVLEPYFALAEELDIPVAYHVGLAPPGVNYPGSDYFFAPRYRMQLSDPLLLEDVLMKHPKLRLYVMHAGWPMLERMIGLLYTHSQVYAEVGFLDRLPRKEYYAYLRRLVDAGFGGRIMFGSDQIPGTWPGKGIEAIESADFLTEPQKRDIFYNNAARFLGLK